MKKFVFLSLPFGRLVAILCYFSFFICHTDSFAVSFHKKKSEIIPDRYFKRLDGRCFYLMRNVNNATTEDDILTLESCAKDLYHNLRSVIKYQYSGKKEIENDRFYFISYFRIFHVLGHSNPIYTTIAGKEFLTGAVAFSFEGVDNSTYIVAESPISSDSFLATAWKYDLETYVTISDYDDNRPARLQVYRRSSNNRTDLHHLSQMNEKDISLEYEITDVSPILKTSTSVEIFDGILSHFGRRRRLTQINVALSRDAEKLTANILYELVKTINKLHVSGPLYISSADGLSKTKIVALATHAYRLHTLGLKVDAKYLVNQYKDLAYGPVFKSNEFTIPKSQKDMFEGFEDFYDFVDILNTNLSRRR